MMHRRMTNRPDFAGCHTQVMTFETSRRNAIQDSTESLKATVMDSAVSDFCHEQHVSTLLKVTDATSWECG